MFISYYEPTHYDSCYTRKLYTGILYSQKILLKQITIIVITQPSACLYHKLNTNLWCLYFEESPCHKNTKRSMTYPY